MTQEDASDLASLRASILELHNSIIDLRRDRDRPWPTIEPLVVDKTGWNFSTYSIHINQRFFDLSLQLQQRFEAQQTSVSTAMVAAEKAVNAALTAGEKAVDKAEQAQSLRNEAQNEFRKSLSDLSSLMWTTKEGTAALDSFRREYLTGHKTVEDRVTRLDNIVSNFQGRLAMIGILWGVIVVVVSAAIRWFH